ncbi:MAG: acyltransferase [Microthrixaceae bacterium]
MLVPEGPRPAAGSGRFPYLPALDGIRGLLVFPVLAFHFSVTSATGGRAPFLVAPGSFFAPSMFFTLSGFLITSLLLLERDRNDGVSWRGFWDRRFRRLVPGSVTVILVGAALPLLWKKGAWGALRPQDAFAALTSVKNWQDIAYASSRNQGLRTLGPLSPYWSLSIEEQFYLGMSLLIGLAMFTRRWTVTLTALFATAAALSVTALVGIHSTPNRELFGTDVRASELLAGCLLALAVRHWGWPTSRWWSVLGWAALALTALAWGFVTEHDAWVLNGGLALTSLLNIAMILGAATRGSSFAAVFRFRPLVEIGKLSYTLYLVHWPVALALRPEHTGFSGWPLAAVRVVVSGAIAWLVTTYVEQPIRTRKVLKGRRFYATWASVAAISVGAASLAVHLVG